MVSLKILQRHQINFKAYVHEIKCPYSARMLKPEATCTELSKFYCGLVIGWPALKKNHDYYYQIQGALYTTGGPQSLIIHVELSLDIFGMTEL